MKKIIYGLLVTTSITGSAVHGTQQPPKRPTTSVPTPLKTDNSVCPDELNMTQLNKLKGGHLKLASFPFTLHTSLAEFEKMLPDSWQVGSKKKSKAKIKSRTILPAPELRGHILECRYTFRTGLGSIVGKEPETFAIKSEPEDTPLSKKLVEAFSQ
jgi:hypothetical protein